jgi:hypothetical protein
VSQQRTSLQVSGSANVPQKGPDEENRRNKASDRDQQIDPGAICRKSAENVEENKENEGAEVERLILSKSDGSSVCLAHLLIWMHHKT